MNVHVRWLEIHFKSKQFNVVVKENLFRRHRKWILNSWGVNFKFAPVWFILHSHSGRLHFHLRSIFMEFVTDLYSMTYSYVRPKKIDARHVRSFAAVLATHLTNFRFILLIHKNWNGTQSKQEFHRDKLRWNRWRTKEWKSTLSTVHSFVRTAKLALCACISRRNWTLR